MLESLMKTIEKRYDVHGLRLQGELLKIMLYANFKTTPVGFKIHLHIHTYPIFPTQDHISVKLTH